MLRRAFSSELLLISIVRSFVCAIGFLIDRVQKQIERNEGVLPEESLDEYRKALTIYQRIARSAK
jgi:hypothetical protein